MAGCELILFDCDGVLVDSEIICATVEAEALKPYGLNIEPAVFAGRFAGLSWPAIQKRVEEELGRELPDTLGAEVERECDARLAAQVTPISGVHDLLDNLDQPRAICSNSSSQRLEMELKRTDLWDRFRPFVYSANDVRDGRGKPDPDVYLHAADEFGIDPSKCAVIEDSVHGVTAAVHAGMRVTGFIGGSHSYTGHGEQLMDAGAETVIRRLADFSEVVAAFEIWDGLPE
ncbi:MAG: HAD family phosphatase [Pseudomonadota bacterium]